MKQVIQLFAIIAVGTGLCYEIILGAHLGYVLITGGALAFAISTKLTKRRQ